MNRLIHLSMVNTLAVCTLLVACGSDEPARSTPDAGSTSEALDTEPDSDYRAHTPAEGPEADALAETQASDVEGVAQFALIDSATAELEGKSGSSVSGSVTFRPDEDRNTMQVEVNISGLEPGRHGFHIHEKGDCSAADASSAGGHFNPFHTEHGAPGSGSHHLGDLGNVEADQQGEVNTSMSFEELSFSGPNSILQKALIVHAGVDDFTSQPSGNAGARVGCGEIRQNKEVLADDLKESQQ